MARGKAIRWNRYKGRAVKIVLLCTGLWFVGAAHAQTDRPWWQPWLGTAEPQVVSTNRFSEDEKNIIQSYFRETGDQEWRDDGSKGRDKPKKKKNLPPGLRKKLERGGELPPGWQKKVERGEVLDAELYRQSRALPDDLLDRLADPPYGTEIRLLDDRVVRILNDTQIILDVLSVY
jgi:hypothetical protein